MRRVRVAIVVAALLLLLARARALRFAPRSARPLRASDGSLYRVHMSHFDPRKAADVLARLNEWTVEVLRRLRAAYGAAGASSAAPARRAIVANILRRYDPDALVESSPLNSEGDTAFVVGKGTTFAMCLREKDPAESGDPAVHDFHNFGTLCFVKAHELSHLGINEYGHPPEFWECFKFVLREAAPLAPGGRGWPNYRAAPVKYCGLVIDYNPLYDPSLPFPD